MKNKVQLSETYIAYSEQKIIGLLNSKLKQLLTTQL